VNKYFVPNRIEFAITYLCNSQCRHCQRDEAEKARYPDHVDKKLAGEIVREVGKKHHPESVMTFGGEPLLYPDIVCAIHDEARRSQIPIRDVITNGFWSARTEKIQEIALSLVESGVNKVTISVDTFHQEIMPLEIVRKTAQLLLQAGMPSISWNPCWVISREHENPFNQRTRTILSSLEDLHIRIGEGNVVRPEGRALVWLKDFLPAKTRMPKGKCGDIPYTERLDSVGTLFVEPDGKISVCNGLCIGNAFETDVLDIIERYDPFRIPEAKALIEDGIEGLVDWARTKGVEPSLEGYYNVCHMCKDLRRRAQDIGS